MNTLKSTNIETPTARAKQIFDAMCDTKNWKLPTSAFVSSDPQLLREVAYALTFYTGGHEVTILNLPTNTHKLRSCGYYQYVGA